MAAVRLPKRPVAPPKKSGWKKVLKVIGAIYLASIVIQLALHDWSGHPQRVAEAKAAQVALSKAKAASPACAEAKERLEAAKIGLKLSDEARAAREEAREVVSELGLQAGKDTSSQYWARVGAHAEVTEREKAVKEACK